jgi:uncharacterized protein YbcC (UPF0753/DUF2309 family)
MLAFFISLSSGALREMAAMYEPIQIDRQKVQGIVQEAADAVASCWPLRAFIYRNPLQGFEHLPFDEAILTGKDTFGGNGYLPSEDYRALYQAGRITDDAVIEAIGRSGAWKESDIESRLVAGRIKPSEIAKLHLIYGVEGIRESTFRWKVVQEKALQRYRHDVPDEVRRHPETLYIPALWKSVLQVLKLPDPSGEHDPLLEEGREESLRVSEERRLSRLAHDLARLGRHQTLGEWVENLAGIQIVAPVNDQMIRWCSAFLDTGMATVSMPSRDLGFYRSWRELARYDHTGRFLGIRDLSSKIRKLPDLPEEAIAESLYSLGIEKPFWVGYLRRHLAFLPGWTGLIKQHSIEPLLSSQSQLPIDLVQYLAVRLFYESVLVESICHRTWNVNGRVTELAAYFRKRPDVYPVHEHPGELQTNDPGQQVFQNAWRLFHLAQLLGLSPEEVQKLDGREIEYILDLVNRFQAESHGPIWLEALELSYRQKLLSRLSSRKSLFDQGHKDRPHAQAVFCIDARSEGLRRYLEGFGNYETFGFAGFFGVPICYRPYDSAEEQFLCPALIKPKQVIVEKPRQGHENEVLRHETGSGWCRLGHGLFHDLKSNNFTAYLLIDLLGGFWGLSFIGKTLFPRAYQRLRIKLRRWLTPPVATELCIDQVSTGTINPTPSQFGFTLAEQAAFVENGLRLMGLTQNFARLILLCAHGSASENNPYASAYDCGACGGNHGGPNARVLAAMANKPEVRADLQERGIGIPEDAIFIAAEHNTTTDRVTLLGQDQIPSSHHAEADQLMNDLHRAGMRLAQDRVSRLPGAPKAELPEQAFRHVEDRSADWSQVRPEWGLSSNAAFIVGRRDLTREIDLEGRVFMHSYDPAQDISGKALETIMTAPLLVVQWISMEYYFSSVDPWVYGSGTKVLHNVVAGVGVMLGRQGDLRPGLPMQSVMNGDLPYHEPMRPLVVIEAPKDRIMDVIGRHAVLQRLFDNRWVNLLALEPDHGVFQEYRPGGHWEAVGLKMG